MAIHTVERSRGIVRVVIADVLTPEDALAIRELSRRRGAGVGVTVDVRSARSCPAHSLLMLCGIRSREGLPLAFVGLSGANQRLLRYFGLEPGPAQDAEPGQADPE